ncbi:MAG TPA: energy transducer TonB [Terriglobales bacterium]|nr:energy transducer TonB [Terriglobales bacterium]
MLSIRRFFAFFLLMFTSYACWGIPPESVLTGSRKVIEKSDPSYPAIARKNHLTGTVKLRVVIGPEGHPRSVQAMGGNPVFVESATDSVKKWKWATTEHETTEVVEVKFEGGS